MVATSLTYLQNQCPRMNYPEHRKQGLAITSCHIESTVKQLNYRVKGSEMFWTDAGAFRPAATLGGPAVRLPSTGYLLEPPCRPHDRLSHLRPFHNVIHKARRAPTMGGCRTGFAGESWVTYSVPGNIEQGG